jgi:2Fe-2S ferredoxin
MAYLLSYAKKKNKYSPIMSDIKINIQNSDESITTLDAPTDMGLSLMEFLKGNEYDILATCGGMALCATCHVEVIKGYESLPGISDDEYAMLDTLPNITDTSRLSCQLKLSQEMDGITVKIMGDGLS